jgi:hypothetical protein
MPARDSAFGIASVRTTADAASFDLAEDHVVDLGWVEPRPLDGTVGER